MDDEIRTREKITQMIEGLKKRELKSGYGYETAFGQAYVKGSLEDDCTVDLFEAILRENYRRISGMATRTKFILIIEREEGEFVPFISLIILDYCFIRH